VFSGAPPGPPHPPPPPPPRGGGGGDAAPADSGADASVHPAGHPARTRLSYAEMLRLLKKILLDHYWERQDCSAYTETTQNEKFFVSYVKFFVIFQVSNVPFIFANNSFSNI
jgi:hypothetical protein